MDNNDERIDPNNPAPMQQPQMPNVDLTSNIDGIAGITLNTFVHGNVQVCGERCHNCNGYCNYVTNHDQPHKCSLCNATWGGISCEDACKCLCLGCAFTALIGIECLRPH